MNPCLLRQCRVAGLLVLLPAAASAQYSVIEDMAASVHTRIGTCNGRVQEVANEITIRGKRLTRFMSSSKALYSEIYNQILVEPDLLDDDGHFKDIPALTPQGIMFNDALGPVSTLFHELAHAEWDILLE